MFINRAAEAALRVQFMFLLPLEFTKLFRGASPCRCVTPLKKVYVGATQEPHLIPRHFQPLARLPVNPTLMKTLVFKRAPPLYRQKSQRQQRSESLPVSHFEDFIVLRGSSITSPFLLIETNLSRTEESHNALLSRGGGRQGYPQKGQPGDSPCVRKGPDVYISSSLCISRVCVYGFKQT